MNVIKWVKRRLTIVSLALSNVEKNSLSQRSEGLSTDTNQTMRLHQGKISDSLINGEVTQEVIDLRWRTYKILKASESVTSGIVAYDKDGLPIIQTKQTNSAKFLNKVLLDKFDDYPLEMVIDNSEITVSMVEGMEDDNIISNEYFAKNKTEKPIKIFRDVVPNFEIENFTKQLKIRKIDEETRLLEFYVSAYPDEYNRVSRLFINNIKKAIKKSDSNTMLEIDDVEFVTYKSLGVNNFLNFKYKISKFDKIVEFNGFYVIKFIAQVTINGDEIFEKYKTEELEGKYKNKLKK